MIRTTRQRALRRRSRKGVETVEAALTLPVLFFVLCPVLHLTHTWHVEKMLKIATYEAIKVAGNPEGTQEKTEMVFSEYTRAFGISNARLVVPSKFQIDKLKTGQLFYFRAEAVRSSNSLPVPFFVMLHGKIGSGWVYYRKEA